MAVNLNPSIQQKVQPLFAHPNQYRRSRGQIKTSKKYRKVRLRCGHIVLSFILLGGFFLGLQQACLYLITCDEFNVADVEIKCRNAQIQADIQAYIQGRNLGSMILLDMQKLKHSVMAHSRIKDIRIRKIFPSSLRISIEERIPAAVLKQSNYKLIDREGVVLEESGSLLWPGLPLLTDDRSFQDRKEDKLDLAWKCLEELDAGIRQQIEVLDFSMYNSVTVKLQAVSAGLILGDEAFSQKIDTFLNNQSVFSQYGELETIDLRFKDRFILTPGDHSAGVHQSGIRKEVR
jgi:cell division septal protein FtsQ